MDLKVKLLENEDLYCETLLLWVYSMTLRNGSLTIAVLGLLGNVSSIIHAVYELSAGNEGALFSDYSKDISPGVLRNISITTLSSAVVMMILNSVLIYGIQKVFSEIMAQVSRGRCAGIEQLMGVTGQSDSTNLSQKNVTVRVSELDRGRTVPTNISG
ncbi:unnamed protein product [Darwinula stevensoni]|uniref:Uncharacterized protein n=1 Tax=Darwinula stevensoni TaxID=69355 RepID=A0A7R8XCE6_9CRUS|nr:unnamed protein product [Darwinula stevensoni]CAG0893670.1 unnamed protein product [Darwinula stevensoni]